MKLGSIDRNRENGVFHDEDGLIPEGINFFGVYDLCLGA